MAEVLEISESSEPGMERAAPPVDRQPRDCLEGIYEEAQGVETARAGGVLLEAPDLGRLRPGGWLNDRVIDAYMGLLRARFGGTHVLSTHAYPSMRGRPLAAAREWFGGVDLASYEYVLVPVHSGAHWALIVVAAYDVEYYNSLGGADAHAVRAVCALMEAVHMQSRGTEGRYRVRDMEGRVPRQQNGDDCGVFCCMYARHRIDPECGGFFPSSAAGTMRRRMLHELLAGEIIYGHLGQRPAE